jgi:hypothetical protein
VSRRTDRNLFRDLNLSTQFPYVGPKLNLGDVNIDCNGCVHIHLYHFLLANWYVLASPLTGQMNCDKENDIFRGESLVVWGCSRVLKRLLWQILQL